MAHRTSSSSRGCGTCGGGHRSSSAPAAASGCGCGGGGSAGCGCGGGAGCGCGTSTALVRTAARPMTRTYDSASCPTFAISCETKQALRDCAKVALCDLLRCVSEALCPDGQFDLDRFSSRSNTIEPGGDSAPPAPRRSLQTELLNCLGQAACSFMHCVPEALCPEPCNAAPVDCLPCSYAVEVVR